MEKTKIHKKLPKKFVRKWVNALRSGKYKQGSGTLHDRQAKSYCCLGVACAISGIPLEDIHLKSMPDFLPADLQKKLPPFLREGIGHPTALETLAKLNDRGCSFEKIADRIERLY